MAEGDDRSRMKDDRADAFIWCMIHLAGGNQGDWGIALRLHGLRRVRARVNDDKDKRCANCGEPVSPLLPKHAGGRPAQVPWSDAYLRTCPNAGTSTPPGSGPVRTAARARKRT